MATDMSEREIRARLDQLGEEDAKRRAREREQAKKAEKK